MPLKTIFFLLLLPIIFGLFACQKESEVARVEFRLTDAPGDFEEVNIDIRDIKIHTTESVDENARGWQSLENFKPGLYNILALSNGLDTLLGDMAWPSNKISQIRLILGPNNSVKVDGKLEKLLTPSSMQSGLKLRINQTIEEGKNYNIILDFDAARSIIVAGSGRFILRPVIKAISKSQFNEIGAIKGVIHPAKSAAAVFALVGNDTIAGVWANPGNGRFLLRNLPANKYKLIIAPRRAYKTKEINDIPVGGASIKELGNIFLEDKE